jgi:hypothetical protein
LTSYTSLILSTPRRRNPEVGAISVSRSAERQSHALISDIATAGSQGKLDEFLLDLSHVDFDSVAAAVIAQSQYGSRTTGEATKHVLERIDHFVSGHKFQAECGCYFN